MKALAALAIILAISGCIQGSTADSEGDYHVHTDFRVYLEEKMVDFNKAEYMSTEYKEIDPFVHLHDFHPGVIHFESRNADLNEFFSSIGMKFNSECFNDGTNEYCSNASEKLGMYVNGKENSGFGAYKPSDLDKILIYYGSGEPTQEMFNSITNEACIYSEKCPIPEGFDYEPENCSASQPCVLPGT